MTDLTENEKFIVRCIAQGMFNKEIAAERGSSVNTVRNQVCFIMKKLEAQTRSQAVYIALKEGIIS